MGGRKDPEARREYQREWERQHKRRAKPCYGCGGEKDTGERKKYCSKCLPHNASQGWNVRAKPGPCRSCGAEAVHLHHAVPRSKSRAGKWDLRNGLPLCASCHNRWHQGYPIRREVFTQEEWDYISTMELTGELIGEWLNTRYPSAASIVERALVVA